VRTSEDGRRCSRTTGRAAPPPPCQTANGPSPATGWARQWTDALIYTPRSKHQPYTGSSCNGPTAFVVLVRSRAAAAVLVRCQLAMLLLQPCELLSEGRRLVVCAGQKVRRFRSAQVRGVGRDRPCRRRVASSSATSTAVVRGAGAWSASVASQTGRPVVLTIAFVDWPTAVA
jgi:hypothetical protein